MCDKAYKKAHEKLTKEVKTLLIRQMTQLSLYSYRNIIL